LNRPAAAIGTGAALLGLVALMAVILPTGPLAVDRSWSEAMYDIQTPFLTHVALIFNALGHGVGWFASLGAVAVALAVTGRARALVAFAAAELLTSVTSALLKAAVGRPRPPEGLVHTTGSSFPSGHTSYAGATCVALVLLFTRPGSRRGWWWALAAVGIAGMAWSRTYLHVHWLSDVIGGAALGIGIALVVIAAAQLRDERRRRDEVALERRGDELAGA
jgi:undecaprenyl-diphosphatase